MAQRKLRTVLYNFLQNLQECRHLAADAYSWSLPGTHGRQPYITRKRRDSMTELAFLRAFVGWEVFLEESFILYLLGQKPPRGRPPNRYTFPPDLRAATEWVVPEGREYARWNIATQVAIRADRHFRSGGPFASVLRRNQNTLDEARFIRNAIAHDSESAYERFEQVVRNALGTLPPRLTVGAFLGAFVPGTAPPVSFLEYYIEKIDFAARQIVPS